MVYPLFGFIGRREVVSMPYVLTNSDPSTGVVTSTIEYAETPVMGISGTDINWEVGILLFCIVLWAFFRMVGVVLKCK